MYSEAVNKALVKCMNKCAVYCCTCCLYGCFFGFLIGLVGVEVARFVMGIVYIDDCSRQPLLPVYMIMDFSFHLLLLANCLLLVYLGGREPANGGALWSVCGCLMVWIFPLTVLVWDILANFWLWHVWRVVSEAGQCNHTTATATPSWSASWQTPAISPDSPLVHWSNASSSPGAMTHFSSSAMSTDTDQCLSCDQALVNFTYAVFIERCIVLSAVVPAICSL